MGVKSYKQAKFTEVRVADYRVIYTIEDFIQLIEVQRIRHRKDAYKG